MIIQAKKISPIRGPILGIGRHEPYMVNHARQQRRPANFDPEQMRMLSNGGVPMNFDLSGLFNTVKNVVNTGMKVYDATKPYHGAIKTIADTAADTVRGKSGGIEAAAGEVLGNTINSIRTARERRQGMISKRRSIMAV